MKFYFTFFLLLIAFTISSQNNTDSNCPVPENYLLGEYQVSNLVSEDPALEVFDDEIVTITGQGNIRSFNANIYPSLGFADDQIITLNLNCGIIQINEVETNITCDTDLILLGPTSSSDSSLYDTNNPDTSFSVNYIEDVLGTCAPQHLSTFGLTKVCSKPQGIFFSNNTSSSVDINWLELNQGNANYEVEYGLEDFSPGNGTIISNINSNSATINNIQPNTEYDFYIKTICGQGDETSQAGPFTYVNIQNSDFFEDATNNTCKCPDADFGDVGTVEVDGQLNTFTKRTEAELRTLIDNDENDPEIALTCTSGITAMDRLFSSSSNFNQNISSWDVSNVINMSEMFYNASSFNRPIGNWDVGNVVTMNSMFDHATSFNQPLENWNVSSVESMVSMFRSVQSFNQPIDNWDVSSVESMESMFFSAQSFNQPLNNWNVSNTKNTSSMFFNALNFNQPLNNWDVSEIIEMINMFRSAESFDQPLTNWNIDNVTNMSSMFRFASSFNQNLDNWNFNENVILEDFISDSNIDPNNYDLLLQSFDDQGLTGLSLGANSLGYCDVQTRDNLIINKGWQISGDILAQCGTASTSSTIPFITTWNINSLNDKTITINTYNFYDYNYSIDWGDGQVDSNVTGDISHEYNDVGTYTISIQGTFPYFRLLKNEFPFETSEYLVSIDQWGDQEWKNMSRSFSGAVNLEISASDIPDLSNVIDMSEMFRNTAVSQNINNWDVSNVKNMSGLFRSASLFNQPLNNWDMSNVTNISAMFSSATAFNQPLDNWDLSNVKSMSGTFAIASSFNQNINNWDVSNVIDMSSMFLESGFDQSLDAWDVSNVIDMTFMFRGSGFDQSLDAWNVSNVTNMNGMFQSTSSFNQALNTWNVSNVISMSSMFRGAEMFNQPLDTWNVSNVISMNSMFKEALSFDQDLSFWNYNSNVELDNLISFSSMSTNNYDALLQSFNNQNLVNKNFTSSAIGYCDEQTRNDLVNNKGWFIKEDLKAQCGATSTPSTTPFVTTWDINFPQSITIFTFDYFDYNFDIDWGDGTSDQNVTGDIPHFYATPGVYTISITGVFPYFRICDIGQSSNCSNSQRITSVESWGDQKWLYMNSSFQDAGLLTINATDAPDLSEVSDMGKMFFRAEQMNANLNNWDVSNVTNMAELFRVAKDFNQLLDSWDVSQVKDMSFMFNGSGFNQNINSWDVSDVKDMNQMFAFTSFNQNLDSWDVSNVTNMFAMFGQNQEFDQDLSSWDVSNVLNMTLMFAESNFNHNINSWDVSSVTEMNAMFRNNSAFNQPLNNWDVSSVLEMFLMFQNATSFNKDISDWCVEQIPLEPNNFSLGSPLEFGFKPNWGSTCQSISTQEFTYNEIKIYPNPASNVLYVSSVNEIVSVRIFDTNGRLVQNSSNVDKINIEALQSGIYLIRLKDAQGRITIKRFIKKR